MNNFGVSIFPLLNFCSVGLNVTELYLHMMIACNSLQFCFVLESKQVFNYGNETLILDTLLPHSWFSHFHSLFCEAHSTFRQCHITLHSSFSLIPNVLGPTYHHSFQKRWIGVSLHQLVLAWMYSILWLIEAKEWIQYGRHIGLLSITTYTTQSQADLNPTWKSKVTPNCDIRKGLLNYVSIFVQIPFVLRHLTNEVGWL